MNLDVVFEQTPQQMEFLSSEERFTVVTKGRRFGATHGAAISFIEWMIEGLSPLLWVDTIYSNIDRYFERYFLPCLRENGIPHNWNSQKKIFKIFNSVCDFRSADRPENIEGFGYKKAFLNEAGIILKNPYLYTNAILPMMMDFPDSQLIAAGVPKGKVLKNGEEHPFYTLYKRAEKGVDGYRLFEFTSYDNPLLSPDDVKALENEIAAMSPEMVEQEIYGKFIDVGGQNPFAYAYSEDHEREVACQSGQRLRISVDWNLDPFCATLWHIWRDKEGFHAHCFEEISLRNSSIPEMADRIKEKYGHRLSSALFTGDSMGKQKDLARRDNMSNWEVFKRELETEGGRKVRSLDWRHQFQLPHNPTHENSRADVNFVLAHLDDFAINPITCPNTCRDMKLVQCDAFGGIVKRNRKDVSQQADMIDTVRYAVNTWLFDFIKKFRR